ncbi:MAG: undecaprenyl-diphosphate phosphatase [Phycisphaeraceae bacterium]|nr:undecaprenyl-diphosphate phosphatase [Phycisphaeraceae bacterium]
MELWQAAALGFVEGITEYLPVSSTGHLIITSDLIGLRDRGGAVEDFSIIIQGGAILAVAGLYFPRFVSMLMGLLGRDAPGRMLLVNLVIAFVPAAALGLAVHGLIKEHLFRAVPVIVAFIAGGLFMIAVDRACVAPMRRHQAAGGTGGRELRDLTPGGALFIGLMQCLSLWPGTSRSMMTITGGVMAGLRPAAAAEFSFLLGMPTLLAATGYALYKNLKQSASDGTPNVFQSLGVAPSIVGMAVAAVCAAVAVKWLVAFLNRHGLTPFGVYRIVLGLVLIGLIASGLVTV